MDEKIYVVTLHKHEDLEQFYEEMESGGFRLEAKRPLSRNTHYWMTSEQAEVLRNDPRVWDVQLTPEELGAVPVRFGVNNTPYTITGNFWKDDTVPPGEVSSNDLQWGFLHCAGTETQRRKGVWGSEETLESVNDTVTIFNDGKHVDVVICDDPVSYDCEEWKSPTTGLSRFVQYQWFNELNTYIDSIDDDSVVKPTGAVTYYTNETNPIGHGVHVAGTVAGKFYGWAREANIYGLQVLGTMPSGQDLPELLIFDYLRAFHRYKPINPVTGRRNPTITNHSWGYATPLSEKFPAGISISNVLQIGANGVVYNAGNPNPSGWTMGGIEADFGIGADKLQIPFNYTALNADAEDAVREGIVVISAAGNANFQVVLPTDPAYNNYVKFAIQGDPPLYFNRGSSPSCAPGVICVGALDKYSFFNRALYSNFGPRIDVFAPGSNILSSYNNSDGGPDSKYPAGNYYNYLDGTSMASPQVTGVAALLAGSRKRFTNDDMLCYLRASSIKNDMTFDIIDGSFSDPTCRGGSPNSYLHLENPRKISGYMDQQSGDRKKSGVCFPRKRIKR